MLVDAVRINTVLQDLSDKTMCAPTSSAWNEDFVTRIRICVTHSFTAFFYVPCLLLSNFLFPSTTKDH
jgi:hypothetical protein